MDSTLLGRDPGAPFVTYYDDSRGERTELSTTSLLNWQAKTANLLRDGYGCSGESTIGVALPLHWLTPVLVGAISALDATLVLPIDAGDSSDAALTTPTTFGQHVDVALIGPTALSHPPDADDVLACSLRPMAQDFAEPLPPGIDDYTSEVRVHGDHFAGLPSVMAAPAVRIGDRTWSRIEVEEYLQRVVRVSRLNAGDRILFADVDPRPSAVVAASALLAGLGASGVIVVGADQKRATAIADQENVSRTFDWSDTELAAR